MHHGTDQLRSCRRLWSDCNQQRLDLGLLDNRPHQVLPRSCVQYNQRRLDIWDRHDLHNAIPCLIGVNTLADRIVKSLP